MCSLKKTQHHVTPITCVTPASVSNPLCGFRVKQGGSRPAWHGRGGHSSVVKAALPVVRSRNRVCRGSQSILVAVFSFFFSPLYLLPHSGCYPQHPSNTHACTATTRPPGNSLAINETALTVGTSWPLDRAEHARRATPAPLQQLLLIPTPQSFHFPPPC